MQPGPPDGGGLLLTNGDEGWNTDGGGTSILCADFTDASTAARSSASTAELFEATSPIPSPDQLAAQQDYVAVREVTSDVRAMAADARRYRRASPTRSSPGSHRPTPRPTPAVARHDGVVLQPVQPAGGRRARRSTTRSASTTWAVWITTETPDVPSTVHRAYAWDNCARGLADSQTCV